ncbi:hypothetical protein V8B97DRAFT_407838 [Scleroderma yunnanense]
MPGHLWSCATANPIERWYGTWLSLLALTLIPARVDVFANKRQSPSTGSCSSSTSSREVDGGYIHADGTQETIHWIVEAVACACQEHVYVLHRGLHVPIATFSTTVANCTLRLRNPRTQLRFGREWQTLFSCRIVLPFAQISSAIVIMTLLWSLALHSHYPANGWTTLSI